MRDLAASSASATSGRRALHIPIEWCGALVLGTDAIASLAAGLCASLFYQGWYLGGRPDLPTLTGTQICLTMILLVAQAIGRPKASEAPFVDIRAQSLRLVGIWVGAHLFFIAILFLLKVQHISRGSLLASFGAGLVALVILRTLLCRTLRDFIHRGLMQSRPIALFQDGYDEDLAQQLRRTGHRLVGSFTMPSSRDGASAVDELRPQFEAHVETLRQLNVAEVIVAVDWRDADTLEVLLGALRALPVRVRLVARTGMQQIVGQALGPIGRHSTVEVQRQPISRLDAALKRVMDLVLASLGLLVLSPLLAFVVLLVKLDSPGPALFRQTRIGFNGQPFRIFKFRTMTVMEDGPTIRQATRTDNRITAIGRILRRTSIDELPQLLNVLMGHMSLVGPRPHARAHDDEYSKRVDRYFFRHRVKPGITGWAQVQGCRGETRRLSDMERRIALDLWYIDHWSMWLDLKIIILTVVRINRMTDAY
ncbi:undecaprenyl-phosphate glucose phosphotransferase [Salinarimonas soli]|uniref:Undecaprenyl-phosphate glucose phosphotransferase n=1 Tax=Salinarimonas soli TaxID=1638099 RepID=A0A5B2W2C2_9HYPH|nr:undecaprenyl-phosphate glucose phosphotransferase [Salinarimonas soli]KAA2244389.1 undecaprenyl-phosphate glucose phosphotransferase [Salinarimonas soli]